LEPQVTVLTPFKNSGPYLKECIESVLQSSFKDFEFLLIDDFSTDNSRDIAEKYSRKDSRISLYSPHKPGLIPALNRGLDVSQGKYIARMDSDDICCPERLAKQVQELSNNPDITLTSCLVECFSEQKLTEGLNKYIAWLNSCQSQSQIAEGLLLESPLPHPSVMFRRTPIMEIGGYLDYNGPEDYDLWIRLAEAGCKFSKVPEVLLNWRMYSTSFSKIDARYTPRAIEKRKFKHVLWTLRKGAMDKKGLTVMGAGKKGGRLGRYLLENGLPLKGFIDIDLKKQDSTRHGLPVQSPEEFFAAREKGFILGYVTAWGAREIILKQLLDTGRLRGRDFIIL